jgi:hypothetical protein
LTFDDFVFDFPAATGVLNATIGTKKVRSIDTTTGSDPPDTVANRTWHWGDVCAFGPVRPINGAIGTDHVTAAVGTGTSDESHAVARARDGIADFSSTRGPIDLPIASDQIRGVDTTREGHVMHFGIGTDDPLGNATTVVGSVNQAIVA